MIVFPRTFAKQLCDHVSMETTAIIPASYGDSKG